MGRQAESHFHFNLEGTSILCVHYYKNSKHNQLSLIQPNKTAVYYFLKSLLTKILQKGLFGHILPTQKNKQSILIKSTRPICSSKQPCPLKILMNEARNFNLGDSG